MSFAASVKNELATVEAKSIKDELKALLKTSGNISIVNQKMAIIFKTDYSKIAYRVFKEIHQLYNCKPIASICQTMKLKKNKTYVLKIEENVNIILEDLNLLAMDNIHESIKSNDSVTSFLAGCFMACGSVNDPQSTNYHLELPFLDLSFAKEVLKIIEKKKLSPKIIRRRNYFVVYLKRSQEIADFLALINATKCYFDFEQYRIIRDLYNSNNRVANCDIANFVKTNLAANEQIKNINIIKEKVGLNMLDENLQIVAKLRVENPESSLNELTEKYNELTNTNISKSSFNRMLEKIKNIAQSYIV